MREDFLLPPGCATTGDPCPRSEVAFITDDLPSWQVLSSALADRVEVVVLDADLDGLAQMADWARTHSGYSAIHVLSHGAAGLLRLGSLTLDDATLSTRTADLATLGAALTQGGDLLLYGCNVAAGDTGAQFVGKLAQVTGADVAASTDLTGVASRGGDWVLEGTSGQVDAAGLQVVAYREVLYAPGDSVIDLGASGKLIAPVQVESKWYYFWDRSGDGTSAGDTTTHDVLDGIFNQDINGTVGGGGNTTETYRYATINGVQLALPTDGLNGANLTANSFKPGTAYSFAGTANDATANSNTTYDDLLAIWDAKNGATTDASISGTPSDWQAHLYWSATPSSSGHAYVHLLYGLVADYGDHSDGYVALQLVVPDNTSPTITNLNADTVTWAGVGSTVALDASTALTISDTENDPANWNGSSLTVQRSGTALSSDVFSFSQSGFTVSGSNLQTTGPTTFGTFTNTNGLLSISFNTSATNTLVQDVMRGVLYRNDTPTGDTTVRFSLSDGVATTTADVTVASDTIYVTNTSDTATISVSDGLVSFSEAVAIAAADVTGSQTLVLGSAFATSGTTLAGPLVIGENLTLNADAVTSGTTLTGNTITIGSGFNLTVTDTTGNAATIGSILAGSGGLIKTGAGSLTLSGANTANTYTGATMVSAGTLTTSAVNKIADTSAVTVALGATLALGGTETIGSLSGAGTLALGSFSCTIRGNSTFSGNITGTGGLNFLVPGGSLTLSGNNTFTGNTLLGNSAHMFLSGGAAIADTVSITVNGTSILTLQASETIGNLTGNNAGLAVDLGSYTLTTGGANIDITFPGVISGTGNLVKIGSGIFTTSGANTYSGTTTVSGGTLSVTGSLANTGSLSVASGATLAGSGSVGTALTNGAVTVLSGGILAPGVSAPGTLTLNNGLTVASGGTVAMQLNSATAGTGYDQIVVKGGVDLTGSTLSTTLGYTPAASASFTLIDNDLSDAVTGTFNGLSEGATFSLDGGLYRISYAGGSGNDVVLSVVPVVTLSVNNASIAEAAGTSTVTATLSAVAGTDTLVTLTPTGTATGAGTDYTLSSTTITILAGQTTGTASVTAVQDTLDEANETVILDITAVTGGDGAIESGTQQKTVTITDDDPTPSLSIANVSIAEGNSGSSNLTFTVTLSTASGQAVSVDYASSNGSATAGSDYTAASGTLTFAAGDLSKTFTVPIAGDTTTEPDETISATLSSPSNATLGTSTASGTITNDDNARPTLTSNGGASTASISIAENTTAVTTVTATDADLDTVTFSITGGTDSGKFAIDATTGALTLATAPNFEAPTDSNTDNSYVVDVTANDGHSGTAMQTITVNVTNLDEVAPTITSAATATAINENSGASQVIYTASSTDTGDTATGATTYSLKAATGDVAAFSINASTGAVTLTANPNFEAKSSYTFTVVATDAASNASEKAVALAINNLDEVAPTITSSATAIAINENSGATQVVYTATSTDTGDTATGSTVYSLKAATGDVSAFSINANTGAVTLTGNPNFEVKSSYSFTVVATDSANNASEKAVTLAINNLDEVAPTITSAATAAAISENSGASQLVYTATSTDTGDIATDTTVYSLKAATGDVAAFSINASTGAVTLTGNPNFETKSSYSFTVVATDAANNSAEKAVTLAINNLDEVAPTITSAATATAIAENSGAAQEVYTATSTDTGDTATGATTYSLKAATGDVAAFSINATTGAVTLTGNPNFEAKPSYAFTVVATDAANNASEKAVTLAINNLDEVAPTITSAATATAIAENSGASQVIYSATSTDSGDVATGSTTYSLKAATGDVGSFSINASTGAVTLTGNPDFEAKGSYAFTVVATDAASNASENAVTLTINNLDEVAPSITSAATAAAINENSGTSQVVYTATSTDSGDIATGSTTYSLKAATGDVAAFSINASTGAVTLTGNPDFETKSSYSFTVVATDAANNASEKAVALAITNLDEVAPTITSGATATAINENSGASQVIYSATSTDSGDTATGATVYSLKAGSDAGLTINATTGAVTLTGNPNFEAKPSYAFTVVATDAANNASEKAVTLAINNLDEVAPTITSAATATAIAENSGASQVIYSATSTDSGDTATGATTYSLKAGSDAGLTINATTGAVTLTANPNFEAKSSYAFTVVATDAANNASEKAVTLAINNLDEVAPTITSAATATAINENSGAAQVVYMVTSTDTADISAWVSYSLGGTDAGLFSISSSTGAVTLSANPNFEAKSSYSFTVLASDGVNTATEKAVNLGINNLDEVAPTITSSATATAINENSGAAQVVYTVTSTDIGDAASAGVSYSLKAGSDAALFGINSTTGAVTLAADPNFESKASYAFTVLASDGVNAATEQAVTLAINNLDEVAPSITSGATATAINENSGASQVIYTVTSTDTGDAASAGVSYSLKAGQDAALFSISSSTGAVTLAADPNFETKSSYAFTVLASDGVNAATERAVTLAITNLDEVAPTITSSSTATAIHENSGATQVIYTATSTDTGDIATGATVYSLKAGQDAALLSIDSSTGAVTLPANPNFETKSSYAFTVLASDGVNAATEKAVSLGINNVNEGHTGNVSISGNAIEGQSLGASDSLADPDGLGSISHKWYANGVAVGSDASYTLSKSEVGKTISVQASYVDKGGYPENELSAATDSVAALVDGTAVVIQSTTQGAQTTTTQTVAPVTVARSEDTSTINTTLADIPLATDSSGAAVVQASLPVGVGLTSSATVTAWGSTAPTLREQLIAASDPRVGDATQMSQIIANGIDQYVPTVTDSSQVTVRTITLTVAAGNTSAPTEAIHISGSLGTGESDTSHPLRQEALVIDASHLPSGTVLDLDNVEFAIIIGPVTACGGAGRNYVIGDGSAQTIILGADDDIIHGGAGNDVVGSKGGNDQLFGDEGNDTVVGGLGDDHLEGGAGDDLLMGGQSDAGLLSFSQLKNQLTMNWTPGSTELADSTGWSNTGNHDGGAAIDPRLGFMYQSTEMRETVTELYQLLLNKLPTVEEMNFWSTLGYTVPQLEQGAANMLLKYVLDIPTQYQVKFVMEQLWGAGNVTNEQILSNTNLIIAGGSWGQLVDALIKSDSFRAALLNADGSMTLTQLSSMADSGCSSDTGADTLLGGAGDDTLVGGHGNDVLDGGDGTDTAVWFGLTANFELKIVGSGMTKDVALLDTSSGEVDIIRNIEQLQIGGVSFDSTKLESLANVEAYLASHTDHHLEVVLVGVGH